jgi:hypothetical protein
MTKGACDSLRQRCVEWRAAQEANDRDDALIVVKVGEVEALLDAIDRVRNEAPDYIKRLVRDV